MTPGEDFDGDARAGALFKGPYRYRCWRHWGETPGANPLVWLMLNPSTADAVKLDPTLRKCRGFSERLGHDGMEILNIFAWKATDPKDLVIASETGHDVVGPDNDRTIEQVCAMRRVIVACGAHGFVRKRLDAIFNPPNSIMPLTYQATEVLCLKTTKDGWPSHPLYIPYDVTPQPWRMP